MKATIITLGLATVMGLTALGQEADTPQEARGAIAPGETTQGNREKPVTSFNKASTLIGSAVQSADGKEMGKVQDLVFNLEKGELAYAVIALGANGKVRSVAVPTRALKPADKGSHLVLNMSEAVLAATEGLQDGEWPGTEIFAVGSPASGETGSASSSTPKGH